MIKTIDAIYDGKVFRPNDPLLLEPNTHVRLSIETVQDNSGKPQSFLATARSLNLDGPSDWAANLENYLYGEED
jgi:predicted DNA-binding antitoxin AbrB/MazE fold protein